MDELHSITNDSSTASDNLSINSRSTNDNIDKNSVTWLLDSENKLLKGYLCNRIIFGNKAALDVQLMNFFI